MKARLFTSFLVLAPVLCFADPDLGPVVKSLLLDAAIGLYTLATAVFLAAYRFRSAEGRQMFCLSGLAFYLFFAAHQYAHFDGRIHRPVSESPLLILFYVFLGVGVLIHLLVLFPGRSKDKSG